nr:PREDICTED: uncharacterized protein LOC661801 isoform X1 [Tribolium castaneum]|eukprot:XP_015836356.1 PREDICTED: uncharacterized protein LOC661801 isoform X1 [Tribolium castaneum]
MGFSGLVARLSSNNYNLGLRMFLGPLAFLFVFFLPRISGHGRLIDPPSRASAWRYGFDTPHNYNDHELYCGGFTRQWVKNEGKCGVCGDAWDSKIPRAHEFGGTYGQGVIVRKYTAGSVINIRVELTANHFGYFTFAVCPDFKRATQKCLDKHVLKLVKPQEGVDHHHSTRYYPKEGNKVYEMKYRLPKATCDHCLFQWRYIAGNNWGTCPNGTGAVGCGPQEEFRACADVTISGKGVQEMEEDTTEVEVEVATTTVAAPPSGEETHSPITALVLSLVSFLLVFLILSLLYIHFYQVGKQLKSWLKGDKDKEQAPMPPPRTRRARNVDGLDEVDLKVESVA